MRKNGNILMVLLFYILKERKERITILGATPGIGFLCLADLVAHFTEEIISAVFSPIQMEQPVLPLKTFQILIFKQENMKPVCNLYSHQRRAATS